MNTLYNSNIWTEEQSYLKRILHSSRLKKVSLPNPCQINYKKHAGYLWIKQAKPAKCCHNQDENDPNCRVEEIANIGNYVGTVTAILDYSLVH